MLLKWNSRVCWNEIVADETPNYSEAMSQRIDQEISQILDAAYQRAKSIIIQQKDKLENLAKTLLDIETVERPQFEALMA